MGQPEFRCDKPEGFVHPPHLWHKVAEGFTELRKFDPRSWFFAFCPGHGFCDRCWSIENVNPFNACSVCGPILLCTLCRVRHIAELDAEEFGG